MIENFVLQLQYVMVVQKYFDNSKRCLKMYKIAVITHVNKQITKTQSRCNNSLQYGFFK